MMETAEKKLGIQPEEICTRISIEKILKAIGLTSVETIDPLNQAEAVEAVKRAADLPGVKAIIFKSPCIAVTKPKTGYEIQDTCINCRKCIRELGCPAIVLENGKPTIEKSLCTGCSLCTQVCPCAAIVSTDKQQA